MDHFTKIEKRLGCDIGRQNDLHPKDGKWRVGKSGFDKTLKLTDMIELAHTMKDPRPNIVIKAGKNAKWYLKYCEEDKIDEKIEKTKWISQSSRCTTYIITWE